MNSKHEKQKAVAVLSRTYTDPSKRIYSVYAKTAEVKNVRDDWTLLLDGKFNDVELVLRKLESLYNNDDFMYVGAKEFDLDNIHGRNILTKSLDHVKSNRYGLFEFSNGELKEWSYDVIEPLMFVLKD